MERENKKNKLSILFIILAILIIGVLAIAILIYTKKTRTITQKEFAKYTTEIEITTENWKDYLEIENITRETKDSWGEVTSTTKEPTLKLKDNMYGYMLLDLAVTNDNLLEPYATNSFSTVEIHPVNTFHLSGTLSLRDQSKTENFSDYTSITMEDLKCSRAKGKVYLLNLPDDIWQTDKNGKKYFYYNGGRNYEDEYIGTLSYSLYLNNKDN